MNLTEVHLPSEQYSLFAGDVMFVWQFILSGKVFCPVYEADRSQTYDQTSRVLLDACAVLSCLPGCSWIISTVPMVRNISRHSLYFCIRFLIGLIVDHFPLIQPCFMDQINSHVLACGSVYSGGRLFKTRQD